MIVYKSLVCPVKHSTKYFRVVEKSGVMEKVKEFLISY